VRELPQRTNEICVEEFVFDRGLENSSTGKRVSSQTDCTGFWADRLDGVYRGAYIQEELTPLFPLVRERNSAKQLNRLCRW